MKYLFTLLLSTFIFSSNSYIVKNESSSLEWVGSKITGSHNGYVDFLSGKIIFNDKMILTGNLIVDMQTITNEDISDLKYRGYLVNHLKNEDFFSVDSFPYARLDILKHLEVSDEYKKLGFNTLVECDLTIKGITHKVDIPMTLDVYSGHAIAKGSINIDRTLYNIRYKSKTIFPDLGDRFIYDDFTLNFMIRANREWIE
tara:strand:- start:222 stop:821 length:600 start_codon:yes stop_codon:yes gene_type:complete